MDRNTDFSFMTAGRGNECSKALSDAEVININAIVTTFGHNSLETSAIYAKHSKRKLILAKDIQMAMKYETFVFLKRDTKLLEKYKKKLTRDFFTLKNTKTNDETNDEEEYTDDEDEYTDDEEENKEEFTRSECPCELCTKINQIEDNWEQWVPQNDIERILKKNIDIIQ